MKKGKKKGEETRGEEFLGVDFFAKPRLSPRLKYSIAVRYPPGAFVKALAAATTSFALLVFA